MISSLIDCGIVVQLIDIISYQDETWDLQNVLKQPQILIRQTTVSTFVHILLFR